MTEYYIYSCDWYSCLWEQCAVTVITTYLVLLHTDFLSEISLQATSSGSDEAA